MEMGFETHQRCPFGGVFDASFLWCRQKRDGLFPDEAAKWCRIGGQKIFRVLVIHDVSNSSPRDLYVVITRRTGDRNTFPADHWRDGSSSPGSDLHSSGHGSTLSREGILHHPVYWTARWDCHRGGMSEGKGVLCHHKDP